MIVRESSTGHGYKSEAVQDPFVVVNLASSPCRMSFFWHSNPEKQAGWQHDCGFYPAWGWQISQAVAITTKAHPSGLYEEKWKI